MNSLIRNIVKEIIKESINIDDQNIIYFGKPDNPGHVVLKDDSLGKKTISLSSVMQIDNTVASFEVKDNEINYSTSVEPIPKGDLRIEAFSLYRTGSYNKNNKHADSFSLLNFAQIMKNQFNFEAFKTNNPDYSNLRIEEFPEYSAARDFLENNLIKEKIEKFNPGIILFPESSSTFNYVLKKMMSDMYPGAEILTTLKQSMLTSFNVDKTKAELKRSKLKQSIVDPKSFAESDPNIQKTGITSRKALEKVNTEIFSKVERIIRQTLLIGPTETIPAIKIHTVGTLSKSKAWRAYISNMHTICYDKSIFPIQKITTDTGEEIDVPQTMMSIAFCYGMVLFYYASTKFEAAPEIKEAQPHVMASGIIALQDKLADIGIAQQDIQKRLSVETDQNIIKDLQNQLDILNTQSNKVQSFVQDQGQLKSGVDLGLSKLENIIQEIESHVISVYRGIAVKKEDLVDTQSADSLFVAIFNSIIDIVNKNNSFKAGLENLFAPKEIASITAAIGNAIKSDKKSSTLKGDSERAGMLSFFNRNKLPLTTMLNRFLIDNLAKTIVANMKEITFPIKISSLTSSLVNDPLAIFRDGKVEINPGVFCEIVKEDIKISGSHPEIEGGDDFKIKIFKYILDKIIVIDSTLLENKIKQKFQDKGDVVFKRILNRVNKNFNVPVMKNILIIDDNIATGATLSIIANEINSLVKSNKSLNFNIEKYQTKGSQNFRSVDREMFSNMEKDETDIPEMRDAIIDLPDRGMNIDALLKNIICISPILLN